MKRKVISTGLHKKVGYGIGAQQITKEPTQMVKIHSMWYYVGEKVIGCWLLRSIQANLSQFSVSLVDSGINSIYYYNYHTHAIFSNTNIRKNL